MAILGRRSKSMDKDYDDGAVQKLYSEAVRYMQGTQRRYWLNSAFLSGKQWLRWSDTESRLVNELLTSTELSNDRFRAVVNRIRSNQRVIVANLTKRELVFEVHPNRPDDTAISAARLAESVLVHLHSKQDWEVIRERLMVTTCKGGTGVLATDWDPITKLPKLTPLSIVEAVPQPGLKEANKARWWIKIVAMPPQLVKELYGLSELPDADVTADSFTWQNRDSYESGAITDASPPLTRVFTYYERPVERITNVERSTDPNPFDKGDGEIVIEVGGKRVWSGDWYFPFKDRLNFEVARETIEDNLWYGSTYLDDARRIQALLNAIWTNLAETAHRAATIRAYVPDSAFDRVSTLTDEPGALVPWPDGSDIPQWDKPPSPAQFLESLIDRANLAIDDLMGIHDVTRGISPPNIESGSGISILADKDGTPTEKLIKETARVFSSSASMCLMLYEKLAGKEREIVVDSEWGPDVVKHSGSDISGQHRAIVPKDLIIPRNRSAQMDLADKALASGLVQGIDEYATLAELPGQKYMLNALNPDIAKARRENVALMQSKTTDDVAPPATFDDNQIHIRIHNDLRKSQGYELAEQKTKDIIDAHVILHEETLIQQRQEDIQMAGLEKLEMGNSGLEDDQLEGGNGAGSTTPDDSLAQQPAIDPSLPVGAGPEIDPITGGGAGVNDVDADMEAMAQFFQQPRTF